MSANVKVHRHGIIDVDPGARVRVCSGRTGLGRWEGQAGTVVAVSGGLGTDRIYDVAFDFEDLPAATFCATEVIPTCGQDGCRGELVDAQGDSWPYCPVCGWSA